MQKRQTGLTQAVGVAVEPILGRLTLTIPNASLAILTSSRAHDHDTIVQNWRDPWLDFVLPRPTAVADARTRQEHKAPSIAFN